MPAESPLNGTGEVKRKKEVLAYQAFPCYSYVFYSVLTFVNIYLHHRLKKII